MASTRNFILLGAFALGFLASASAANSLFTWQFEYNLNPPPRENVTRAEVEEFFTRTMGSEASRCKFLGVMVGSLGSDPLMASVLYDYLQINNGSSLSPQEFAQGILGISNTNDVFTNSSITQRLNSVAGSVNSLIGSPDVLGNTVIFHPRTGFLVEDLANDFDADRNGVITVSEITMAMRRMDSSGDWGINRCEFVDSMQRFRQNPVSSAKLYDEIFRTRDIAWADVDSIFLASMMDRNRNSVVTREEFVWWFTMENDLAWGLQIEAISQRLSNGAPKICNDLIVALLATAAVLGLFTRV